MTVWRKSKGGRRIDISCNAGAGGGVRIAAIALVVTAALGTGERTSILLIMTLVLVYTFEGGMKAVIWTDVVQFLLYISGSLAAFFLHAAPDSRGMANRR